MRVSAWVLVGFVFASVPGAFGQAPNIPPDGVVNGATFLSPAEQPLAPGSIISIFGSNFALPPAATVTDSAANIPLPNSLGGISLRVNDVPVPLIFVFHRVVDGVPSGQINAQLPWEVDTSSGMATLTITRQSDMMSSNLQIPVATASPGIFTFEFGPGAAAVTNIRFPGFPDEQMINGSIAQSPDAICGPLGIPNCQAAPVGGIISIFANGLGDVDPDVTSGDIPRDLEPGQFVQATNDVRVLIGGQLAQVLFAGLSNQFVGLNQINAVVPDIAPGNNVPIVIEVTSGETIYRSREDATISVRAAGAPVPN